MHIDEEMTEELVDSFVEGVKYNFNWPAFSIMTYGDALMMNCIQYIQKGLGVDIDNIKEHVEKSRGDSLTDEQVEKISDDMWKIVKGYYDKP